MPIGRIAAVVALAAGAWAIARDSDEPRWRTLRPGLEFATLSGEPFCRRGSSHVALLRVDPRRVGLRVHHYRTQLGGEPLTILEWRRKLGALAVFNAGQYYPDYTYMGLLVSGGRAVSKRPHPGFRAALVADRAGAGAAAAPGGGGRVIDLEREPLDPGRPGWREVAQSFMLFDRGGGLRVRRSDQVANRTVVGEDREGRLVIVTSEGGYTLWEFAELLRKAPLQLTHAMAMDGGHEAGLCVRTGSFRYASFGRWDGERTDSPEVVPLPAVIAVVAP